MIPATGSNIDWSGQGNNWGIGLPIASQNSGQWSLEQPLLANGALKASEENILTTTGAFQELLRIRMSSPLFRLATAPEIEQQLQFLNTGPNQIPGLIVMELAAAATGPTAGAGHVVVVFNATNTKQTFTSPALADLPFVLDPIQSASVDPVVRTSTFDSHKGAATVPALTTAVFVAPR